MTQWRDPLIGLLVAAACLVALELGSRAFGRFPGRPDPLIADRNAGWNVVNVYDHLLFWRMARNVQFGRVSTNSFGLRGPEIPAKQKNEFRVLSLGESTTAGAKLAYSESYSFLLERSVPEIGGRRLRVVNAGAGGYTLVQGYAFLLYRAPALEPDAVLLYFGHNDYLSVPYRMVRNADTRAENFGADDWTLLEQRRRPLSRLAAWLLDHSNLVRALRSALLSGHRDAFEVPPPVAVERSPPPRVPEEVRRHVLERIRDHCVKRGLHLTIIVPWYRRFSRHEPLLREFAAEAGLTLVDLPELLGHIGDRSSFFFDSTHPTAEGHRLIAQQIAGISVPAWRDFLARREAGMAAGTAP